MMVEMPFDSHPEAIGTVMVIGALLLGVVRFVIAWRVQPDTPQWPAIAIGVLGIGFAVTRLAHFGTTEPGFALLMIRLQYGIGLVLPGLGIAAIEVMSRGAVTRRALVMVAAGGVLFVVCAATPWLVHGPMHVHLDGFGHEHLGAEPAIGAAIVLPVAVGVTILELRRRLLEITGELARQCRGFVAGAVLFAVAGLIDSLLGAGVLRSVFVLEYVFVAFGLLSANYELRRTALLQLDLLRQLVQKRSALEEREASLKQTSARLDRSNVRYRHLADATREGVILCSGVEILDVNEAAGRLLGGATPATPRALRLLDLRTCVVDTDREALQRMLHADLGPIELELVCVDGSKVPVSAKSVAAPEGSKGTRVLLVRDVSAERDLQRRLATADRLAAVGTLAAGTAHEINNPLAFVLSNADLLEELLDGGLPDETAVPAREMIADIRHGALRIRDVVRDLMSLAREKGGEVTSVDLNETLRRCIAMAAPQTRHRARVVSNLDELAPVRANEGRLFQVFLNLIVNAAQAIPEGAADRNSIRIAGRNEGATVVIEITDTGSGMPREVLDHIFEPFFTTKAVGQGTGLGLSISHGIVTDLGGRIDVDSTLGVGTRFRVILPANGIHETTAPIRVPAQKTPRLRVLIVDDEQRFAQSLARMLDAHDVDVAHSGRAALEQIASHRYDVALCDVMMPDVTGIQLYQQLCAAHDPITDRFLFMTGGVASPEAQQFLEQLGAKRWVPKPIPMADLRRMVVELGARPS